jgi:uncharacterized protein (TIGR01732 family)
MEGGTIMYGTYGSFGGCGGFGGCGSFGFGGGYGYALILVLFILLVIIGSAGFGRF